MSLFATVFLGAVAVAVFQYVSRRTLWARSLATACAILCVFSVKGSTEVASKLERQRTDAPSSREFRAVFVPERGNFEPKGNVSRIWVSNSNALHVPILIESSTGINHDASVVLDYVRLRIQYPNGEWVEAEAIPSSLATATLGFRYQTFYIENQQVLRQYEHLEGRAVLDFSLVRLRPGTAQLQVGAPRKQIEGLGRCDAVARGSQRVLRCLQAGLSTLAASFGAGGAITNSLMQRDPFLLASLPGEMFRNIVAETTGHMDTVYMTTYRLESEHTIRLEIPKFRINDWK